VAVNVGAAHVLGATGRPDLAPRIQNACESRLMRAESGGCGLWEAVFGALGSLDDAKT
jgi:hypothetical protein